MTDRIIVLVADDHIAIASALTRHLGEWFATMPSVNSLLQLRGELAAWSATGEWRTRRLVVLLGLSFRDGNGLTALPALLGEYPEPRFLLHSAAPEQYLVRSALREGASGFVDKSCGTTELRQAIESVGTGSRQAVCLAEAVAGVPSRPLTRPLRPLTPALRRLLGLLASGRSRPDILAVTGITNSGLEAAVTRLRRAYSVARGERLNWKECSPE